MAVIFFLASVIMLKSLKGMFVFMKEHARIEKPKVVKEMLLILSFFRQKKNQKF